MDFPDNATTNVHKIVSWAGNKPVNAKKNQDGINSIQWKLYLLEVSKSSDPPDEEETKSPLDNAPNINHAEPEQISEFELRSKGFHVLNDTSKNELWIFYLPEPIMSMAHDNNDEKALRILNSSGMRYRQLTAGSLDASDLYSETAKTPGFSPSSLNSVERINTQAFGANSFFSGVQSFHESDQPRKNLLDLPTHGFASIFTKMIEAVLLSISYDMANNLSYSPLGTRTYVKSQLSKASVDSINNTRPRQSQSGSSLISISIRWWPSGDLTISSFQLALPEMRRVLDSMDEFRHSAPARPTAMILSPSGKTARYLEEYQAQTRNENIRQETSQGRAFRKSGLSHDSIIDIQNSITGRLARLGIHLSPREVWLWLEYAENCLVRDDVENWQKMPLSPGAFIWPASLCFYIGGNEYQQRSNPSKFMIAGNNDPLADAESWYKAKIARQRLIEAANRQDEMDNKIKEEPSVEDEDDGLSDFVPRTNQYITTQDANGIYPTPPDGLPTQGIGSSNPEAHPSSGEFTDKEVIGGEGNEGPLTGSPFMGSLDPIIDSTVYDPPGGTDFYDEIDGEMDNELFADNILTEADFSFFDKPSIEDDMGNSEDQAKTSTDGVLKLPYGQSNHDDMNEIATGYRMNPVTSEYKSTRGDAVDPERTQPELVPDGSIMMDSISFNNKDSIVHPHEGQITKKEPMLHAEDIVEANEADHKTSFQSVSFREKLQEFDIKYVKQGRFGYDFEDRGSRPQEPAGLDKLAIPRIGIHYDRSVQDSKKEKTFSDLETDTSDDDSNSHIPGSVSSLETPEAIEKASIATSRKRKRDQEETSEHPTTPICSDHTNNSEGEGFDSSMSYLAIDLFKPDEDFFYSSSLSMLPQSLHPEFSKYNGHDRNFIQVAQILVEQLVLQTEFTTEVSHISLEHSPWNSPILNEFSSQETMSRLFPRSETCNLKTYVSVEKGASDIAVRELGTGRPAQRDQPSSSKPKLLSKAQPDVVKLPAPYTCIRRNQTPMDVLAPALFFWEELGLGPSHGDKDIVAICICPAIDSVQQGAGTFLNMLGSAYQSCKLGNHNVAPDSIGYSNGIVPVPIKDGSFSNVIDQLNQTCEKLGTSIGQLNAEGGNTVIYMINPFKNSQAIPYLCSASLKIFETYTLALKSEQVVNPNDLILQIIPLDLVSSSKIIVLPLPLAYRRLAFEVYDRCPPNISPEGYKGSQSLCAPSIRLARAIPKMINLTLSPEPTASLLQSDMCFHLAYAWDPTQEWLTASWTDNQGDLQWNTPYCLGVGDVDECWPILLNIIKEIWETTLEMLYPRNSPWRLYIAKHSPMHKRELEAWLSVTMQPSLPTTTCTFLVVNPNPPLQFPPPLPSEKPPFPFPNAYDTPTSTPAANIVFPDTLGLVCTPGGNPPTTPTTTSGLPDVDTDAKLVDITDESWGLVLPFPNTDPLLPSSLCPSLGSGYLLKRAGTRDEDGLIAVGVDIVHGDAKGREAVLREVLSMYRGLATLARLRGVVDRVRGVLPWHVAVASRAGIGVNSLMSWDGE